MRHLGTAIVAGVLFPLHESLKGHRSVRVRRELERTQWWPRDRIESLQRERLRQFLADIGRRVLYFRELFAESGFDPDRVTCAGALHRLPMMTKELIRTRFDSLRADAAKGLRPFHTGGSTGEPLKFLLSKDRISHDIAAKWRATRWWGVDIGDPEIVVWGSPIETGRQDRMRAMRDRVIRSRLLSAFEMSPARLDSFVDTIRTTRPRMLFGYPSALAYLAGHAERSGVRLDTLGIAVAFVTAELLYPDQRGRIERVFGCRVANGYGGRDAGFVAHECPDGGMHISAEDIVVEVVDAEGRAAELGRSGEIVVTHLATRDFPFVRYRTGDVAALQARSCTCGRGLPLLGELQGRSTDFLVAQDGTVLHGLSAIYVLREIPGLEAFKIVQESRGLVRVEVVTAGDPSPAVRVSIEEGLRRRLGTGVEIRIERVGQIQPEASGKYRYVISRVSPDEAGSRDPRAPTSASPDH